MTILLIIAFSNLQNATRDVYINSSSILDGRQLTPGAIQLACFWIAALHAWLRSSSIVPSAGLTTEDLRFTSCLHSPKLRPPTDPPTRFFSRACQPQNHAPTQSQCRQESFRPHLCSGMLAEFPLPNFAWQAPPTYKTATWSQNRVRCFIPPACLAK